VRSPVPLFLVLACCGPPHYKSELVTEERPAGTCATATLAAREKCVASARDYAVGASALVPHESASDIGASLWYRGPYFSVRLDERSMRRANDTKSYNSLAGGIDFPIRSHWFLSPSLSRYLDFSVLGGANLGAIKVHSRVRGRFDGFVGAALEVYAPDFGPFRYLDNGVPGLQLGARRTWYVEEWTSETSFEAGLIWRWGTPIDLLTQWTMVRKNMD
jgi:hypothetical protein